MAPRQFRVFLSSTFADFVEERSILHDRVWPALDQYARSRGARFQAVDLRWGISPEAQFEHSTIDICLGEIARSQRLSPKPNFIVLIGQRYGWEPVPARIGDQAWSAFLAVAVPGERAMLEACYRRDDNAVPEAQWLLQPMSDWVVDSGDVSESALLELVRLLASKADLEVVERERYFMSATHQEIADGALSVADAGDHVCAYVRHIVDVDDLPDRREYMDLDVLGARIPGVAQRLANLDEQVRRPSNSAVVRDYRLRWAEADERQAYLEAFASDVLEDQMRLLERAFDADYDSSGEREIDKENRRFAVSRSRLLVGRDHEVEEIVRYCQSPDREEGDHPLWVFGAGGVGKSAVMAAAALRLAEDTDVQVLVRHIGAVPGSDSLSLLLESLTEGLVPGRHEGDGSGESTNEALATILGCSPRRRLVVFLDAIDQLDHSDRAHELAWIPSDLPKGVRLVVSTRPGRIEQRARAGFPLSRTIEVLPLDVVAGEVILERILLGHGRTLSPSQRDALLEAFAVGGLDPLGPRESAGGTPLWLVLAAEQAAGLRSYDPPPVFPVSVHGLIHRLVYELSAEARHGSQFVSRAMAFLASSRSGLSDDEIESALSNDRFVRAEFDEHSRQPWNHQQLPPILWSRLRADLEPYLGDITSEGTLVARFFHREFNEYILDQLIDVLQYDDVVIHTNLFEILSLPHPRDNWLHVVKGRPQDPRVVRALAQSFWHRRRSIVGAFEFGEVPDAAALRVEASLFSYPLGDTDSVLMEGLSYERFLDALLCLAALEEGECESILKRANVHGGLDSLPPADYFSGSQFHNRYSETSLDHPYLARTGMELARGIDSESCALVAAIIDGYADLQTATDAWESSPDSAHRSLRLGILAWARNDLGQAERSWTHAAQSGSRQAVEFLLLILDKEHRPDAALDLLEQVVDLGFMDELLGRLAKSDDMPRLQRWQSRADAITGDVGAVPDGRTMSPSEAVEPADVSGSDLDVARHLAAVGSAEDLVSLALKLQDAVHAALESEGGYDVASALEAEAYHILERAADDGSTEAMWMLGNIDTRRAADCRGPWERGLAQWRRAALSGDSLAMKDLGLWAVSRGAHPTRREIGWLRRALESGLPQATNMLERVAHRICELDTAWHTWSEDSIVERTYVNLMQRPRDGVDEVLLAWLDSLQGRTREARIQWKSTNEADEFFTNFPFPFGELSARLGRSIVLDELKADRPPLRQPPDQIARGTDWDWVGYVLALSDEREGSTDSALGHYEDAAYRGDREAMYRLGLIAHRQDRLLRARVWWERAAAAGDLPSVLSLVDVAAGTGDNVGARAWADYAARLGWRRPVPHIA